MTSVIFTFTVRPTASPALHVDHVAMQAGDAVGGWALGSSIKTELFAGSIPERRAPQSFSDPWPRCDTSQCGYLPCPDKDMAPQLFFQLFKLLPPVPIMIAATSWCISTSTAGLGSRCSTFFRSRLRGAGHQRGQHPPDTLAVGTRLLEDCRQILAHLAGHLHQTKAGQPEHVGLGAVVFADSFNLSSTWRRCSSRAISIKSTR